ncbi:hypothetical protein HN695_01245 [Candidatus Woesearchaeota archaeon]|nr:hypothetical protein [Candidatus Woesearchaeota archaeon]MBT5273026.1 hypothetical protein [Candidatus Woesearchaeota archaeon]MBT6040838.1 hypothetical protein [Candidatus Woesearchaeota archaeon]MBT6336729.1 hypothetical protein [Candidatus Woesearchaeota archaeon]MBT7926940.1 hypothetical protein [Candidatus Woesearchaeota archaeon]
MKRIKKPLFNIALFLVMFSLFGFVVHANIEQEKIIENETLNNTIEQLNQTKNKITYENKANLTIILPKLIYTKIKYKKLFRIDNLVYPNHKINVSVNYNITSENFTENKGFVLYNINKYKSADTGELYFNHPGNYSLCGVIETNYSENKGMVCQNLTVLEISNIGCDTNLDLNLEDKYFYHEEKLSLKFKTNSSWPLILEYWIEDLFGNTIREKSNSTTMNRQLTLKTQGGIEIFKIYGKLHAGCNDTNLTNNNVLKEIIILKNSTELETNNYLESIISIEQVYNEKKLKFGKKVKVKTKILRKNTSKSTIQAYVVNKDEKKVSEITKLGIYSKNVIQEISFYINLKEDCKSTRSYTLILEGLGIIKKQKIRITCEERKNEKKEEKNNKITKKQKGNDETKSKNQKKDGIEGSGATAIQLQLNTSLSKNSSLVQVNNLSGNKRNHEEKSNNEIKTTIYRKQNTKNTTKWLLILLLCLNLGLIALKRGQI